LKAPHPSRSGDRCCTRGSGDGVLMSPGCECPSETMLVVVPRGCLMTLTWWISRNGLSVLRLSTVPPWYKPVEYNDVVVLGCCRS